MNMGFACQNRFRLPGETPFLALAFGDAPPGDVTAAA